MKQKHCLSECTFQQMYIQSELPQACIQGSSAAVCLQVSVKRFSTVYAFMYISLNNISKSCQEKITKITFVTIENLFLFVYISLNNISKICQKIKKITIILFSYYC